MKNILICDMTLCVGDGTYSFKERIEIARKLENLNVDVIELPEIINLRTDTLLIKTISAFVKNSVLSVGTGYTADGVKNAANALINANHPRLRVSLPLSAVGMEYRCHKKGAKMIALVEELVAAAAKTGISNIEFCAEDATRADKEFLIEAVNTAVKAGATAVTLCDDEGVMLPDSFSEFLNDFVKSAALPQSIGIGIMCRNSNGLAAASTILAIKGNATAIKAAVGSNITPLQTIADIIKNCGDNCGFSSNIKYTSLKRIISQIEWIIGGSGSGSVNAEGASETDSVMLDINDKIEAVNAAVAKLGYDLSEEDSAKVYEEFGRVAAKKNVGAKELEAIVASVALQVPPTYKIESYVINSGNIISASADITLNKSGEKLQGIGIGDGPIDASFRTIEQILGHHYELDDFQIQAVTEGREAMGSALVRLRNNGKLYSGNGISTDIIGASIRAYINALNKIVYEEA